jgi:hypothetical protein
MIESEIEVVVNGRSEIYNLTDEEAKFKFISSLYSGVWFINTKSNGFTAAVLADKVDDLPTIMNRAAFEQSKLKVAKEITKLLKKKKDQSILPSVKEILDSVNAGLHV